MPNIYLRLPRSRCQFFRHRDPKHPLAPHEPLIFNPYMPQHFVLRNSLTNASAIISKPNDQCYSHQQWRNMMCGCSPSGGKPIVQRDKNEYLTFAEVQTLLGHRGYDKSASVDYLCIRLPNEIEVVDTVRTVTPSWNIDTQGIRALTLLLNNDFKRSVIEWALATFDFCTSNGRVICRGQTALIERFLMRYDIEPTKQEKDTLRRIIERWLKTEHNYFTAYSCLDMRFRDAKESIAAINSFQWP